MRAEGANSFCSVGGVMRCDEDEVMNDMISDGLLPSVDIARVLSRHRDRRRHVRSPT